MKYDSLPEQHESGCGCRFDLSMPRLSDGTVGIVSFRGIHPCEKHKDIRSKEFAAVMHRAHEILMMQYLTPEAQRQFHETADELNRRRAKE